MRWKSGICCVGRGVGFREDEVVVIRGFFFVSVWDSSSMVVEGSRVVFEVDVLVLWMVGEPIAQCPCQRGLKVAYFLWAHNSPTGRRCCPGFAFI